MEGYKVYRVIIDHFRGYCDKQIFDLSNNADIVLLAGPNGFGKTTFFDALEWGFTGKLTRYNDPNEEKSNSRFINYQPEESPAKVIIEFGNSKDQYTLCRSNVNSFGKNTDYGIDKSKLIIEAQNGEIFNDYNANELLNNIMVTKEWRGKVKFEDVFSQYHLLTQDKLKNFVQGIKATDRYKQISLLFGTDRFLKYCDEFEKLSNNIENENNVLVSQKNKLESRIDMLKMQILETPGINIGSYSNLEQYFIVLVENLNLISMKMDIQLFLYNYDNKIEENSKQFRLYIIRNKDIINKRLFILNHYIDNLKKIEINTSEYKKQIKTNEKLNKVIPSVKLIREHIFIQENIYNYKNYVARSAELNQSYEGYKFKNDVLEKQLNVLLNIHRLLGSGQSNINDIMSEKTLDFSEKLCEALVNIEDNPLNFDLLNDILKFEINEEKCYIVLLEYKIEIAKEYTFSGNANQIFNNFYKYINDEIMIQSPILKKIENDKIILKEKIKLISDDIVELNTVEKDINDILNDSLEFIQNQNKNNKKAVNCPVCLTEFIPIELIKKIEKQLSDDNPLILNKLKSKEILNKDLDVIEESIRKIQSDLFDKFEEFNRVIDFSKACITKLGQKLRLISKEQTLNIEKVIDDLKTLTENNKKICAKIIKLNLSEEPELLNEQIKDKIDLYINQIEMEGYSLQDFDIEEQENRYDKTKVNIAIYESKLLEYKINLNDIDSSIIKNKNDSNESIRIITEFLTNINTIEIKVVDCENYLIMDEKSKNLISLSNELEVLVTNIKKNVQLTTKVKDLQNATKTTIENINQGIIDQSQEFINAIFSKIYSHPNFRNLKLCINLNKRDNNVLFLKCMNEDNEFVNPVFTFSSAQINAIAISIFLSLAIEQKCTKLENIFFDDPVQSMDDINVLAFIDIIRSIISSSKFNRKFIFSTHDEQFHRLMVKKFRFIKTRIFKFNEYNKRGPLVSYTDTLKSSNEIKLSSEEFK